MSSPIYVASLKGHDINHPAKFAGELNFVDMKSTGIETSVSLAQLRH